MYQVVRMRQVLLLLVSSLVTYRYYFLFTSDLSAMAIKAADDATTTMPMAFKAADDATKTTPTMKKKSLNLPDVVKRSLTVPDDPYNITAAICHKSLFGNIDLWMVLDWVAYHRLLGFDRVFMTYVPSIKFKDGFEELNSLPFVTLTENKDGIETIVADNYHRLGATGALLNASYALKSDKDCSTALNAPHMLLEARCIDEDAHSFDWVMISDVDEYLWFNQKMGVKEFLHNRNDRFDYISFGKWMYTAKHQVKAETTATGFHIENFPFTAGPYCIYKGRKNKPKQVCARKNGRAKVMVKPSVHHGHVCVHGTHFPKKRNESIHLSAEVAHFMEWNGGALRKAADPTVREKKNFPFFTSEEAGLHPDTFRVYPRKNDSSATMHYDDNLHAWLDFVGSRGQSVEKE
jgi:hypothetical protein